MANNFKQKDKPVKKKNIVSRTMTAVLNGEFLTRKGLMEFMPFILFLTGLFALNIGIGYFFESTIRENVGVKKQLEELTSEFNTVQSQLENKKQQSAVVDDINSLGLEGAKGQPTIIEVKPGYFEE